MKTSWKFPAFLTVALSLSSIIAGCSNSTLDQEAAPVTITTTSISTQVTTVTETVEVETSAIPTPEEQTAATVATTPIRVSQQDQIYGQVIRGYGVDITDEQVSQVGGPVCNSYDAGGGLDAALGIVESVTGYTGWQATKIVQGVVVGRCSQYADLTY